MTMTIERFSAIVARINRAALYPADWPQAMHEIVTALGGYHGGVVVSGAGSRRMTVCSPGADELRRSYNSRFWRIDPIAGALEHEPAGVITTCEDLLGPEFLRRHRFFSDWMAPNRLGNGVLALLDRGSETSWLGVYPDGGGDLDLAHVRATMGLLLPHLRHALTVQSRLGNAATERDRAVAVLHAYRHGLVIVSGQGVIGYANPAARSILESGDGLAIGRRGHLEASGTAVGLRPLIDAAIGESGARVGGRTLVPRRSGTGAYALLVSPLGPDIDGRTELRAEVAPSALVVIVDPDEPIPGGVDELRQLYGLTAAEARVAAAALRGAGLRSIADELAISVNTVRTHLQRAFEKTGTHRQAELVRVLATILSGTGQFEGSAGGVRTAISPPSS